MAGSNGSSAEVIAVEELGQSGSLERQVKAIEEEIGALVASSRQRLMRATGEELRRILRQNLAKLSAVARTLAQTQGQETLEALITEPVGKGPLWAWDQSNQLEGNSHQALVVKVHTETPEERRTVATPNGREPSRPMEAMAEAITPPNAPSSQVGTRDGQEGHEALPSEIAIIRTVPGGESSSSTVKLSVKVVQSAIQASQFIDELCRHPSMRIQRLLGTAKGRLDIWVQLREPIPLRDTLSRMEGVSQVNSPPVQGPSNCGAQLEVVLKEPKAVHDS